LIDRPMTASDQVSKHLRRQRAAGVLRPGAGGPDGRRSFHEIHEASRTTDAAGQPVLDFGWVELRV
jgi:hypothetical protein